MADLQMRLSTSEHMFRSSGHQDTPSMLFPVSIFPCWRANSVARPGETDMDKLVVLSRVVDNLRAPANHFQDKWGLFSGCG